MGRITRLKSLNCNRANLKARAGFAMIEVLIAVAILATVCTASLKLILMAQNTLRSISEREALLENTREILAGVINGTVDERGSEGDISWTVEDKEAEMFGDDFGRLDFGDSDFGSLDTPASTDKASETLQVKWREITVKDTKGHIIKVLLETKEDQEKDSAANTYDESDADDDA